MFLDPDNNKSYIEKSGGAFRITQTIEALESSGSANKTIIVPLKKSLPDKDDDSFLEVAFTGKIDVIITENKKHFPKEICKNINVLSPSEFLNNYHLSLY